ENVSTATTQYEPEKIFVVVHEGRKYQAVGESYGEDISFGKRFIHLLAVIGLIAAGILLLGIPFLFEGFRSKIDHHIQQLKGREVNIHHIPFVLQPKEWQKAIALEHGIASKLRGDILNAGFSEEIKSAACCLKIAFEGGSLKREFIFKDTF